MSAAWADASTGRFVFNLTFGHVAGLREKYGPPSFAMMEVNISKSTSGGVALDFDLSWWGKKATRMAESLWMTFAPAGVSRDGWLMDKLGRDVDPLNTVLNGSRTMHGVWSGVRHRRAGSEADDVTITSVDAPLVSPGLTFSPTGIISAGAEGAAQPQDGWNWNLFNNAWACNFPLFSIDPEQRFRWRLVLG